MEIKIEKPEGLVHEIDAQIFIDALAKKLESLEEFKMPEWAGYVKTGRSKERVPDREDWWYVRAASILRTAYVKGVVGVSRLRTKYGSRKNRGMRPEKFYKSSGKVIRVILQQAAKAGIVEVVKDKKAGKRLTKQGVSFLENIAKELLNKK
ncbi:MAG: 30S ribosomal protein S19e [Candidatus Pacearchaeota archaeon]|nr:30S ribosomal protein S19e [Candidatus Pacearchaeota archaeon]